MREGQEIQILAHVGPTCPLPGRREQVPAGLPRQPAQARRTQLTMGQRISGISESGLHRCRWPFNRGRETAAINGVFLLSIHGGQQK